MLPLVYPRVRVVSVIPGGRSRSVGALCRRAGVSCLVTGPSAGRVVVMRKEARAAVMREPGSAGRVWIGMPDIDGPRAALFALGVLAYAVFDYAARESLRGLPEARSVFPVGRPRKARPLDGAERQRRWRVAHRRKIGAA